MPLFHPFERLRFLLPQENCCARLTALRGTFRYVKQFLKQFSSFFIYRVESNELKV